MAHLEPVQRVRDYYGGYAQDDWRSSPKLTLNYGVRLEHESGLKEENNCFTVAFDRTLNPGGALGAFGERPAGSRRFGVCRPNGANKYQGNPPGLKFSPRVGAVYSFNPKTVVRAGYGVYWAPWNYQGVGGANYGKSGSARTRSFRRTSSGRPLPSTIRSRVEWRSRSVARWARSPASVADRVHRPGQEGALHPAVLGGPLARAGGQHGRRLRIRRRDGPRPEPRRLERRRNQHQPGAESQLWRSVPRCWNRCRTRSSACRLGRARA